MSCCERSKTEIQMEQSVIQMMCQGAREMALLVENLPQKGEDQTSGRRNSHKKPVTCMSSQGIGEEREYQDQCDL